MRMWMVNPKIMCRQHLLGEHKELHMLAGALNKGRSIRGFLNKRLLEPQNIYRRHSQLVKEMLERGYNHRSPLNFQLTLDDLRNKALIGKVDATVSMQELYSRCVECRKIIDATDKSFMTLLNKG